MIQKPPTRASDELVRDPHVAYSEATTSLGAAVVYAIGVPVLLAVIGYPWVVTGATGLVVGLATVRMFLFGAAGRLPGQDKLASAILSDDRP